MATEKLVQDMKVMSLGESLGFLKQPAGFATKAIHTGQQPEQWSSRAVVPPIVLATTYQQLGPNETAGFDYSRAGNPTRKVLETCMAALENGKYGFVFSSGLGAQTAIISMLKAGDGIITNDDHYSGTDGLFRSMATNMAMEVQFIDMLDLKNLEDAIKPNLKLVWMETPTNPTMKVFDIKAIAKIIHSKSNAILLVDNTLLSPYFQRPLELGADIVMHSMTKYLNGHTDVLMGSLTTNSDELYEKLKFYQNATGIVPSPFDCYLANRGIKTLALRMEKHFSNSLAVAKFLESHPRVEKALHPALPSHPNHKIALSQCYGHSGLMSFYIKDATPEKTARFLRALKIFIMAVSLGGYESLAEAPSAMMLHAAVPDGHRLKFGVTDGLIRLSVGLEEEQDLIDDLDQALMAI